MHTYRLEVTIDEEHHLSMDLPGSFPTGPAQVVVSSKGPERRSLPLGGVLDPGGTLPEGDSVGDALDEQRADRAKLLERRVSRLGY